MTEAVECSDAADRISTLIRLDGIDVPVASAILAFAAPARDIVMGEHEWAALVRWGCLETPFPSEPEPADYGRYRLAAQELADSDTSLVTVQRACYVAAVAD